MESSDARSPESIFANSIDSESTIFCSISFIYPNRLATSIWQFTSNNEPYEISTKCALSLADTRPIPSAIFDGIETAALRSWSQRAYCSSFGKFLSRLIHGQQNPQLLYTLPISCMHNRLSSIFVSSLYSRLSSFGVLIVSHLSCK